MIVIVSRLKRVFLVGRGQINSLGRIFLGDTEGVGGSYGLLSNSFHGFRGI